MIGFSTVGAVFKILGFRMGLLAKAKFIVLVAVRDALRTNTSMIKVLRNQLVLERLIAKDMPPEDAGKQPDDAERTALINWLKGVRTREANKNAGDQHQAGTAGPATGSVRPGSADQQKPGSTESGLAQPDTRYQEEEDHKRTRSMEPAPGGTHTTSQRKRRTRKCSTSANRKHKTRERWTSSDQEAQEQHQKVQEQNQEAQIQETQDEQQSRSIEPAPTRMRGTRTSVMALVFQG